MLYGALEAGGTKMVLAIGGENGEIIEQVSIPTEHPSITMPKIIEYFNKKEITALGVGSFGPIDLNPNSPTYGYITSTPKLDWRDYNLIGVLEDALCIPIGFDTDVNASCLGEASYGSTKDVNSSVYITIGTGIGIGVMVNGSLLHGMLHPEGGHILMSKHEKDSFQGVCPYHANCFESLASGPAIERRYGKKAHLLDKEEEVWDLEAYYIAQAIITYILTLSPERIVLGGGVMHQEQLFPLIRKHVLTLLNGYMNTKELSDIDTYILPSSLHGDQGIIGCIELAKNKKKSGL